MQDAWRAYLELALGLGEASRRKAQQAVRDLAGRGEATAAQLQAAASELLSANRANRETIVRLVRYEVERALGAVGLATADEVNTLTARVEELERRLRDGAAAGEPAPAPKTAETTAAKTVAKRPAKKAVAKKTAAKKAVAKKTAKTVDKQTPPRKAA